MIDSKHWEWGPGVCRKHRGQSLPCQVCIDLKDPDLFDPDAKPPSNMDLIARSKSVSFSGLVRPAVFDTSDLSRDDWAAMAGDHESLPGHLKRRIAASVRQGETREQTQKRIFESHWYQTQPSQDHYASRALPGESRIDTKNRLFAEIYGQSTWAALQSSFKWQEASWLEREELTRQYLQRDRPASLRVPNIFETRLGRRYGTARPMTPEERAAAEKYHGIDRPDIPYHLIQSGGADIFREPVRVNMGLTEFNINIPEVLCITEEESLAVCSSVMENFRTWFLNRLSSVSSTSPTPAPTTDTPSSSLPGSNPKEPPSSKSSG